jgi:hypothetical protein
VVLLTGLVLAPTSVLGTGSMPAVVAQDAEVVAAGDPEAIVDEVLERAANANRTLPHEGGLVVVSFSETGPRIAQMEVAFGDEGLRILREGGTEVGRVGGRGFLRSSSTLLQVGGVEQVPVSLGRLHTKYDTTVTDPVTLDTGPAVPLALRERATGTLREVLYADVETGLIVRRETYGRDGEPVRTVAYTHLAVTDQLPSMPRALGRDVEQHEVTAADADARRDEGFLIPESLPLGYDLVTALEVPGAHVPTVHLIYADGLYSLSVFQQQGRMKSTVIAGASELRTPTGGAVWRWPGSEPRRIVWSGEGVTFTALADTPTDELLEAIAGLPTDPPPSILGRLDRGLSRLARWVSPNDRSNT